MQPVEKLSRERPLGNIFNIYVLLSVLVQFALHIVSLVYITKLSHTYEEWDIIIQGFCFVSCWLWQFQAGSDWSGSQVWTESSQHCHIPSWSVPAGFDICNQFSGRGCYCLWPFVIEVLHQGTTVSWRNTWKFYPVVGTCCSKCSGILRCHWFHARAEPVVANCWNGKLGWLYAAINVVNILTDCFSVQAKVNQCHDHWLHWLLGGWSGLQVLFCWHKAKEDDYFWMGTKGTSAKARVTCLQNTLKHQ